MTPKKVNVINKLGNYTMTTIARTRYYGHLNLIHSSHFSVLNCRFKISFKFYGFW